MGSTKPSRAFVVARQGLAGRFVIAANWLEALAVVLTEADVVDALEKLEVTVSPRGVVARSGGHTWTVRSQPTATTQRAMASLDDAASTASACQRALEAALEVVSAQSGAVLLSEHGYLRFVAVSGPHAQSLRGVRLSASSGVAGYVAQAHRAVVVGDATAHPRHDGALDAITGHETRQIAAVPVATGGVVFGVLELMNPPSGRPFSKDDVTQMERIADVLAGFLSRRQRRRT